MMIHFGKKMSVYILSNLKKDWRINVHVLNIGKRWSISDRLRHEEEEEEWCM